jgi:hypothetical protein
MVWLLQLLFSLLNNNNQCSVVLFYFILFKRTLNFGFDIQKLFGEKIKIRINMNKKFKKLLN